MYSCLNYGLKVDTDNHLTKVELSPINLLQNQVVARFGQGFQSLLGNLWVEWENRLEAVMTDLRLQVYLESHF